MKMKANRPNDVENQPAMRGKGEDSDLEEEQELVVINPNLASLIYHSFNIAFVLEAIFFIHQMVTYYKASEIWWQALLGDALVSPLFILPLYSLPILRDFCVKEYAMGPLDNYYSSCSKLLASDEV